MEAEALVSGALALEHTEHRISPGFAIAVFLCLSFEAQVSHRSCRIHQSGKLWYDSLDRLRSPRIGLGVHHLSMSTMPTFGIY